MVFIWFLNAMHSLRRCAQRVVGLDCPKLWENAARSFAVWGFPPRKTTALHTGSLVFGCVWTLVSIGDCDEIFSDVVRLTVFFLDLDLDLIHQPDPTSLAVFLTTDEKHQGNKVLQKSQNPRNAPSSRSHPGISQPHQATGQDSQVVAQTDRPKRCLNMKTNRPVQVPKQPNPSASLV